MGEPWSLGADQLRTAVPSLTPSAWGTPGTPGTPATTTVTMAVEDLDGSPEASRIS